MRGLAPWGVWLASRGAPWGRRDWGVVATSVVLIAIRWGDRAKYLMTWDSHTFALALERYDVNGLRPHAPGYPVYVAVARAALSVTGDANDAYILVSLAFAALSACLLYRVAGTLADRGIALAAVALLLASPLLHVHAVTANVYSADLACSLAVAWSAWWARMAPSPRRVAVLAAVFALAVGVRPSLAMFLGPLTAWGALAPPWTLRGQARRLLPAAGVGAVVCALWFLPMAMASGGIATWRRANALQGGQVVFYEAVWNQGLHVLAVNGDRLWNYLRWELMFAGSALLLLVALGSVRLALRGGPTRVLAASRTSRDVLAFLALWGLPPLLFYLLVYSGFGWGPSGYALLLLPPFLLAGCWAGAAILRQMRLRPEARVSLAALAVLFPAALMVPHVHDSRDVQYAEHDAWAESWSHLRDTFPASNTSIVTSWSFSHVWFYYPEYAVYHYRPAATMVGEVDFLFIQEARGREAVPDWYDEVDAGTTPGPHPLDANVTRLVIFDFQLAGENDGARQVRDDVAVREAFLPNGWRVLYVDVTQDRPFLEDYFTLDGAVGQPPS